MAVNGVYKCLSSSAFTLVLTSSLVLSLPSTSLAEGERCAELLTGLQLYHPGLKSFSESSLQLDQWLYAYLLGKVAASKSASSDLNLDMDLAEESFEALSQAQPKAVVLILTKAALAKDESPEVKLKALQKIFEVLRLHPNAAINLPDDVKRAAALEFEKQGHLVLNKIEASPAPAQSNFSSHDELTMWALLVEKAGPTGDDQWPFDGALQRLSITIGDKSSADTNGVLLKEVLYFSLVPHLMENFIAFHSTAHLWEVTFPSLLIKLPNAYSEKAPLLFATFRLLESFTNKTSPLYTMSQKNMYKATVTATIRAARIALSDTDQNGYAGNKLAAGDLEQLKLRLAQLEKALGFQPN